MSAYRKEVRKRDERVRALGYVPRDLKVPETRGSLERLSFLLEGKAHRAMLRRIRSS